ncbi:hypothetical protein [Paraburkholderia sp. ZP32-5]|uniref:hypothetical protein n=1 Tax=Paraburkholderia sp. ZP32-5 TaxID=2883245 RepID=UPI001F242850|nr:hypothetical protein [Paraburkholderia sp. ZP32-5]
MNRAYCLIAAGLVALGATAYANGATRDEQAQACRGDAIHFCAAEIPDKEKITACMKQHIDELSPACRAMFRNGKGGDKNGAR